MANTTSYPKGPRRRLQQSTPPDTSYLRRTPHKTTMRVAFEAFMTKYLGIPADVAVAAPGGTVMEATWRVTRPQAHSSHNP